MANHQTKLSHITTQRRSIMTLNKIIDEINPIYAAALLALKTELVEKHYEENLIDSIIREEKQSLAFLMKIAKETVTDEIILDFLKHRSIYINGTLADFCYLPESPMNKLCLEKI